MDGLVSTGGLAGLLGCVRALQPTSVDAEAIDRIRLFEELKSALAAAQAVQTTVFTVSQRAEAAASGVKPELQDRGLAAQVGLARRVSPWQAKRYVGWCAILTRELPAVFAELQAGRVSEWRAMLVARETMFLSRADRAVADAELAPQLAGWSDRRVEAETRRVAYRLDPHGSLARTRGATKDRRVSIRPAPEAMCRFTGLLPVAQGVAAYAALCRHADTTLAAGDERGRGQIMADTLVERVTGQATAEAVPVEIELVMTDTTLLGDPDHPDHPDDTARDDAGDPARSDTDRGDTDRDHSAREDRGHAAAHNEPAEIVGFGPIPAGLARELALADTEARRTLRRLFRRPSDGQLAAMESTAREFTGNLARFIRLRDQARCRTLVRRPLRHTDHLQPWAHGGQTTDRNGNGRCAACNYAKQAPGWRQHVDPDGTITTTTPTGHRYRSRAPDPPGSPPPALSDSLVERELERLLALV